MKLIVLFIIIFGLKGMNMAYAEQLETIYQQKHNEASKFLDEQIKIRRDRLDAAKAKAGKQDLSDEEFIEWVWEDTCKRGENLPIADQVESFLVDIDNAKNVAEQALAGYCIGRVYEKDKNIEKARLYYAIAYEIKPEQSIIQKALKRVDFFPPVLRGEAAN